MPATRCASFAREGTTVTAVPEREDVKAHLRQRITAQWSALSRSERIVAEYLIKTYPDVAFETVQSLGAATGTSGRTALRLVQKLGYAGFPALQSAIQGDIVVRLGSPATRLRTRSEGADPSRIDAQAVRNIESVSDHFRALELLAQRMSASRGRVFIHGAGKALALATYLWHGLSLLKRGSTLMRGSELEVLQAALDIGPQDFVIVCEFRRYPRTGGRVAQAARRVGGKVVAISDSDVAPAAVLAEQVFAVPTLSDSIFDSYVAAFLLTEVFLGYMAKELPKEELERRLEDFDRLAAETHVFSIRPD